MRPVPARADVARLVWILAGVFVGVEMVISARYGFHRDELYFVAAGRRPAFGYVDQPPLAPLLTRLSTAMLGTSPSAIRLLPALAGAGVVVAAGFAARELGGGRIAQTLAALAAACAPVLLAGAHLANTTVYDLLAWSWFVILVLMAMNGRPRLWLVAGVVAGVALENKDLIALLVVAVGAGLLITGRWRELPWRFVLGGAAIAVVLWAPNLAWQATHHWPELTMSRVLRSEHSAGSDYATVVPAQLLYLGLGSVPLAVVGVRHLVAERNLRFLTVAVAVVLVFVVLDIPGRPYYTAGLLPVVFAAGAVEVERRVARGRSLRPWVLAPLTVAVVGSVLVLPILPIAALGQLSFMHKLNYDQGETVGWPQLTAQVAHVVAGLPPAEKPGVSIFTANYGEAGAIDRYGPGLHLPEALSGHNNYWLWGPGHASDQVVVAVGAANQLQQYFDACPIVATFHSPHNVNNDENGVQIALCSGPHGSWQALWPKLRHYD